MCVCNVCVCDKERESDRVTERERDKDRERLTLSSTMIQLYSSIANICLLLSHLVGSVEGHKGMGQISVRDFLSQSVILN